MIFYRTLMTFQSLFKILNMEQNSKNKLIAALLAIFLGGLGIHKFYMGQTGKGILFLLLCWTGIPEVLGLIQGIVYLCDSEERFAQRCAKPKVSKPVEAPEEQKA